MKIEMAKMFCYLKVLHFNHDVLGRLFKTAGHWAKSWHLNRRSGSLSLSLYVSTSLPRAGICRDGCMPHTRQHHVKRN